MEFSHKAISLVSGAQAWQKAKRKMQMLNIKTETGGDGDFLPWAKYNAKAGRWYVKTDGGSDEVSDPKFVIDFANIKTGWFHFEAGQAPSKVFDPDLSTAAEKPSEKHKRGFEVVLYGEQSFGGAVEFCSTSALVGSVINELYMQYDKEKASNAGKLPVVEANGASPSQSSHGTNYTPNLKITKWVDVPAELTGTVTSPSAPEVSTSASEF